LYGVLKPLDAIKPYRLEMGAKMGTAAGKDLYAYWGTRVAESLRDDLAQLPAPQRCVVNVASAEYYQVVKVRCVCARARPVVNRSSRPHVIAVLRSAAAKPHVELLGVPVYTMVFHGATVYVKAARGAIVRYAALSGATSPEQLRGFTGLSGEWRLNAGASSERSFVFERGAPARAPAAKAPPRARAGKRAASPAAAAAEGETAAAAAPAKRGARAAARGAAV
jgi:hypothetical protein